MSVSEWNRRFVEVIIISALEGRETYHANLLRDSLWWNLPEMNDGRLIVAG